MVAREEKKPMGAVKSGDRVIISTLPGTLSSLTRLHLLYTHPVVLWAGEKPSMHRPFLIFFLSIAYLSATQACVQYYLM